MVITTKLGIDLQRPLYPSVINAVQGDQNTRELEISLYSGGVAFELPEGTTAAMRYGKPDNTKGIYDTMPDGSSAFSISGNTVSILLAPQMLTVPGTVSAQVVLMQGANVLSTFGIQVHVEEDPSAGVMVSEDYTNWLLLIEAELDAYLEKLKVNGEFVGGTVVGAVNMNNQRLYGLREPAAPTDAATKQFVEDTVKNVGALPIGGGTMEGPINMNGQPIRGLNAPTENDQAANMGFVNQQMKKAAPRNLLGNSYFRNPVNQREQTSFTTRGYTIDRWFLEYVGDSGISLSDNGLTFGTTNNLIVYLQKIGKEVRKKLIGKTVTVVATDSNGNVGISTGIIPDFGGNLDSPQVCIDETKLRCNIFCYEAEDAIQIRLLTDNLSSPVTVANIALYEGEYTAETLPEYQQKEYGAELYECRRYYREDEIVEINHGGLSGTIMLNTPFYEPPMRVTPTYTIKNFAAGMGDLSESSAIANAWGGDNRRIKLNYNSTGAASQCVFTLVSNAEM